MKQKDLYFLLPHDIRRALYKKRQRHTFQKLMHLRSTVTDQGYSYKQFIDTKTIFVHIPKTAGISVCQSLYGNLAGGHCSIRDYTLVFSKEEFRSAFKYTFVRNPWDRLYSAYSFLKKGGLNEEDQDFYRNTLMHYKNFEDFVLRWVNKENVFKYVHFIPQVEFLRIPFQVKPTVDFIGFFENISADYEYISNKVINAGDCLPALKRTNTGSSSSKDSFHFSDIYSARMIDVVSSAYETDIKSFGYTFDNSSLQSQIKKRNRRLSKG